MTIRDSFERISVPWLTKRVAGRIQWAVGLILDAHWESTDLGIKARMPGVGTPEALPYIGDDRLIERGPTESDESYAERLSRAFDSWRIMGNPIPILEQLRAYFLPSPPPIRIVSNASVWHSIDPSTAEVSRTKPSPANWVWDEHAPSLSSTPKWWRGFVIIDSSSGPWAQWFVGEPNVTIGDGRTIGSTATVNEVLSIRRILRNTKPGHVYAHTIVVTFDASLFLATDPPGAPMPSGDYGDYAARSGDAAYWKGIA